MKSYHELKAKKEAIQQQMVEAMRAKRANALIEAKRPYKKFSCAVGVFMGTLTKAG